MSNTGSSAVGNTKAFFSNRFLRKVRLYRGYVIVPFNSTGDRGGTRRHYEIWSGDQQTQWNDDLASLSAAKSLIDSGLCTICDEVSDGKGAVDGPKCAGHQWPEAHS